MRRLFNLASLASTLLFLPLLALYLALLAGALDFAHHSLPLGGNRHLTFIATPHPRLACFNGHQPFTGSIFWVDAPPPHPAAAARPAPTVTGYGNTAGIYYRRISYPSGDLWWTFSLSLLYPLALSSLLPLTWLTLHHLARHRSKSRGFPPQNLHAAITLYTPLSKTADAGPGMPTHPGRARQGR